MWEQFKIRMKRESVKSELCGYLISSWDVCPCTWKQKSAPMAGNAPNYR